MSVISGATDAASSSGGDDFGEGGECSVRVYVRIRPMNQKEKDQGQKMEWKYDKTAVLETTQNGHRQYAYDACFGVESTNKETYEEVGKPVVIKAMEGFNGTVFTYGQTGSGKTWTMRGSDNDPGMMILCIRDIFEFIKTHTDKRYSLKVSYMEVYNEEINDLLNNDKETNSNLKITSEDAVRGAVIGNLQEVPVETPEQFMAVLKKGENNRSYASTSMNDQSSRSHVIYRVAITISAAPDESGLESTDNVASPSFVSYMNLVDLAGSERQKSTKSTGQTLKEGANINKSLLALGAVINKLGEASKMKKGQKPVFIPYRDSKLTRILKQSLGGNTLTSILCAISPAPMFREETVSTLKFGQLCKLIKNQVQNNILVDDKTEIKKLKATIEEKDLFISQQKTMIEELMSSGGGGGEQFRADLERAFKEKHKMERKMEFFATLVERLKKLVKDNGGDVSSVQEVEQQIKGVEEVADNDTESGLSYYRGGNDSAQIHKLKVEMQELEERLKNQEELEKEQTQRQEEIDKEKLKFEFLKEQNALEKEENMAMLKKIEWKEELVSKLETKMDDLNSQLRLKLSNLKEQEDKWRGSIHDLTKREDIVKEWEREHNEKDKALNTATEDLANKTEELCVRLTELAANEKAHAQAVQDLEERDQRLRVTLDKIYQRDSDRAAAEKRLQALEAQLKKREGDCDVRDKEAQLRKRENDSTLEILTERDRILASRQRVLDDKEQTLREKEEKISTSKAQVEKQQHDAQKVEKMTSEKQSELAHRFEQVLAEEQELQAKMAQLSERSSQLSRKEANIAILEKDLLELQSRMSGIDEKERKLGEKIAEHKQAEDKYYADIAQISAKHRQELSTLETKLTQQMQIMSNFRSDLDKCRGELAEKTSKIRELEKQLKLRDTKEEHLLAELEEKEFNARHSRTPSAADDARRNVGQPPRLSAFRNDDADDDDARVDGYNGNSSIVSPQPNKTSKDLMKRLADSQRALYHILETNNASHQNSPVFSRRGVEPQLTSWSGDDPVSPSAASAASAAEATLFSASPRRHSSVPEMKQTAPSSPSERSPRKFDLDSPEMKDLIARGRRDGVPVTSFNVNIRDNRLKKLSTQS